MSTTWTERTRPLSTEWGLDRGPKGKEGTPIDRVYIDAFMKQNAGDVRGEVLEIQDSHCTKRYGKDRVSGAHVLDIPRTKNRKATVKADLDQRLALPVEAFDCFIFMQALQLMEWPEVALDNAWRCLKPGGVLLLTTTMYAPRERPENTPDEQADYWRFTPDGLRLLLERTIPDGELELSTYGNVLACCAFLQGMAAQELDQELLHDHDPIFPLSVCARVKLP